MCGTFDQTSALRRRLSQDYTGVAQTVPRIRRIRCERVFRSWSHWRPRVSPLTAAAQQAIRADAALVHAEGAVDLNDRAVEPTSTPDVLPDKAELRTTEGRAAIALKRGGLLFLDAGTSVRVLGNGVYNFNRIEVLTGSVIVASGTNSPLVECESEINFRMRGRSGSTCSESTVLANAHAGSGSSKAPRPFRFDRHRCTSRRPDDDVQPPVRRHDSDARVFARATGRFRSVGETDPGANHEVTSPAPRYPRHHRGANRRIWSNHSDAPAVPRPFSARPGRAPV